MATAKTPAGNVVEVVVTAEHGTGRSQAGQLRHGGVVVACWANGSGSRLPTLPDALVKADETIAALGLTA
jgi:hypothetical protein